MIDIVTFNPQADVFVYIDMCGILNTGHGHWFQIKGSGSLSQCAFVPRFVGGILSQNWKYTDAMRILKILYTKQILANIQYIFHKPQQH